MRDQARLTRRVNRRLFGPFFAPIFFLGAISAALLSVALAYILSDALFFDVQSSAFLVLIIVFGVPTLVVVARIRAAYVRRVCQTTDLEGARCGIAIGPDFFVWRGPDWRSEIAWSSVNLLDDGPTAVMIVSRGVGYFAPNDAFADAGARQAFIDACAAHMTPEARARSGLSP